MAAKPMKTKSAKKRTTKPPVPPRGGIVEGGQSEFLVYYHDSDDQWECDESFSTLKEAEAYCREKAEIYCEDVISGEDAPTPWEFHIYEVKSVRTFRYRYNVEIAVVEE